MPRHGVGILFLTLIAQGTCRGLARFDDLNGGAGEPVDGETEQERQIC